jgi:hypothetical protein
MRPNAAAERQRRETIGLGDRQPSLDFLRVRKRDPDFAMMGPTQSVAAT